MFWGWASDDCFDFVSSTKSKRKTTKTLIILIPLGNIIITTLNEIFLTFPPANAEIWNWQNLGAVLLACRQKCQKFTIYYKLLHTTSDFIKIILIYGFLTRGIRPVYRRVVSSAPLIPEHITVAHYKANLYYSAKYNTPGSSPKKAYYATPTWIRRSGGLPHSVQCTKSLGFRKTSLVSWERTKQFQLLRTWYCFYVLYEIIWNTRSTSLLVEISSDLTRI